MATRIDVSSTPQGVFRMFARAVSLLLLLSGAVISQIGQGDIGVSGFSTSQFSVLSAAGAQMSYPIGTFGGSGTTQSILWDPANPSTFIIGGFGFVGRVQISGGIATYALITTGVNEASQMSWDVQGRVVVADGGLNQVTFVDPASGTVTPLSSSPQPWGGTVNAGAYNMLTGDIYVGNNGSIYRIPFGSTTAAVFTTGWGTPGFVSGITFDPFSLDVVATLLTVNRVVRISPSGAITDLVPAGSIGSVNSVDADVNGDFIVGCAGGQVWRVPNAGGGGVLIGTAAGQGTSASGVAVVLSSPFVASAVPGAPGGGTVSLSGIPAGTVEGWSGVSFDVSLPVGAGSIYGIVPDMTTISLVLAHPIPVPGNPIHWTYPVSAGVYPAAPLTVAPNTFPVGTTFDVVALAIDAGGTITPSTVVRVSF